MNKPNHPQTGGAGVSKDALRNKRRVVKLVTIVTVMFALSWLPIQVLMLICCVGPYLRSVTFYTYTFCVPSKFPLSQKQFTCLKNVTPMPSHVLVA